MSAPLVARKDFEDVVRSWMLWGILGLYVVLMTIVGLGVDFDQLGEVEPLDATINLFMTLAGELILPITALVVGYMAIVGERQSGSLRVLFGLSHNRRDVFAGKLTSRAAVMVLATLVACVTVAVLTLLRADSFSVGTYLAFLGLTLLVVLAFTGIAVATSAMARTRMQSMGGVIVAYVLFTLLWHPLVAGLHYLLEGELVGLEIPDWYALLLQLNPLTAYRHTMGELTGQYIWSLVGWPQIVEDVPGEEIGLETLLLSNRVAGDAPVYLSEWATVAVLLAWFLVPVAVGYWRFQRADLN